MSIFNKFNHLKFWIIIFLLRFNKIFSLKSHWNNSIGCVFLFVGLFIYILIWLNNQSSHSMFRLYTVLFNQLVSEIQGENVILFILRFKQQRIFFHKKNTCLFKIHRYFHKKYFFWNLPWNNGFWELKFQIQNIDTINGKL